MRLGTETGSLVNHLMHGGSQEPKVGMGATILMWTDRHAVTIVKVSKSGKTLWVKRDVATLVAGSTQSESQSYAYSPDPDAPSIKFSRRKDGRWREAVVGTGLSIGDRMEYRDPCF